MTPLVSVLIVNYNYAHFLGEALQSVRQQTLTDFEVIVADDGSSDNSADLCGNFTGLDIRFVSGHHVGLPGNFQRGLEACTGDHVAFLSADDIWLPDHLAACIEALAGAELAAVAYSSCQAVNETGEIITPSVGARSARTMPSGWIEREALLPSQFIPTQAAIVKRDALREIGGFDTSLHYTELDLFVRLTALFPVVYTGKTTVQYRQHGASMSRDHERALAARLALYEKHLVRSSNLERRLVAHAYSKTAYRQLRSAQNPRSVHAARRNIMTALRMNPRKETRPLNVAILAASLTGSLFLPVRSAYERHLKASSVKVAIQRLLLMNR